MFAPLAPLRRRKPNLHLEIEDSNSHSPREPLVPEIEPVEVAEPAVAGKGRRPELIVSVNGASCRVSC